MLDGMDTWFKGFSVRDRAIKIHVCDPEAHLGQPTSKKDGSSCKKGHWFVLKVMQKWTTALQEFYS